MQVPGGSHMSKFTRFLVISGMLAGFLGTGQASAHHAFTAQYDPDSTIQLEGVLVKVEWLNPHAYFYIDVTDEESGEVTTWACELGSPVSLMRQGWTRESLTLGEFFTVEGPLARDGSPSMNARTVTAASTGKQLFTRD